MADHVGTKVSIPGTRGQGILRYQGPIRGKNGIFCGIELIGPIAALRGKNSGSVDGVQYFEVQNPMTGLFLPLERLKTANAHLTSSLRLSSSFRSTPPTELASTPSPLARGTPGSMKHSGSTRNVTYCSPYSDKSLANKNLFNGKQRNIVLNSRSLSDDSSSSFSNSTEESGSNFDVERINLDRELKEVKRKYENSQLEMNEKIEILNELRSTVNEIQPLLEEYENSLSEKDKKLLKQRNEFEKAREEWRQSLDLMVSTQQENEEFYEQQISDLNSKIEDLSKAKLSDHNIKLKLVEEDESALLSIKAELSKYKSMVEHLQSEKSEIEKNLNEKANSQKLQIDTLTEKLSSTENVHNIGQMETMRKDLEEWKAKYNSLSSEFEKLQSEINSKDSIVNETILTEPIEDNELNSLLHDVKSVRLDDISDEHSKLKDGHQNITNESNIQSDLSSKISELENQLEMRPTFEELTDLQNTIDELDNLHKREIKGKEDIIRALLKEKEDLQLQISDIQNTEKDKPVHDSKKPEINTISNDKQLPVYVPSQPIDPSSGKSDWCGLCERDGHSSINCPYENDMF